MAGLINKQELSGSRSNARWISPCNSTRPSLNEFEMTTASQEVSEIDANARFPLSLLLGSALLWLVVSGALALLSYAQALNPRILEDCAFFTFGRTRAMQETALIYGWVANAGFVVALWILGRLGGSPLRSLNWSVVVWNIVPFQLKTTLFRTATL